MLMKSPTSLLAALIAALSASSLHCSCAPSGSALCAFFTSLCLHLRVKNSGDSLSHRFQPCASHSRTFPIGLAVRVSGGQGTIDGDGDGDDGKGSVSCKFY